MKKNQVTPKLSFSKILYGICYSIPLLYVFGVLTARHMGF